MSKTLAKTVFVRDPKTGEVTKLLRGTPVDDEEILEQITNPAAWETGDGSLSDMDDEEIFAAANTNSTVKGGEVPTAKATGSFDANEQYQGMTVPALRALAEERDLDTSGLTRKQDLIDALNRDDAGNG